MSDARRRRRRRRGPRTPEGDSDAAPPPETSREDADARSTSRDAASDNAGDTGTPLVRVRRLSPEERARRQAEKRQRQRESDERPSRMRLVLLLLLGVLIGRILESNYDPANAAWTVVNMVTYGGIAFSIAFLWRRWARRALERRRLEQQRRMRRREG